MTLNRGASRISAAGMTAAPPAPADRFRTFAAIAGLSIGTALVIIDGGIANVGLPTIARELGVDSSAAVLIVTVYQLVLVMTLLPLSAVGDRIWCLCSVARLNPAIRNPDAREVAVSSLG